MPTIKHMRIFMSFHHICLRTRLAPLLKPCAETARLSVLSCSESRRAPRSETLLMLSRMMPTVLSISWCLCQQLPTGTMLRVQGVRMSSAAGTERSWSFATVAIRHEGAWDVLASPQGWRRALLQLRNQHLCSNSTPAAPLRSMMPQKTPACRSALLGVCGGNIPLGERQCACCHSGLQQPAGRRRRRKECTGRKAARGRPW